MKPKHRLLLSGSSAASFAPLVIICSLTASSFATTWEGDVSSNWNDPLNWSGDAGTAGSNAIINSIPANIATISADLSGTPVDILVGDAAGVSGRLIHTAGNASTGDNNWMIVGRNGGTGTYDLADTTVSTPGLTGYGQGSGNMTVGNAGTGGRLYVGAGAGSTGTVNINTSAGLLTRNDLVVGENSGKGTFNLQAGTVSTGGWNFIGSGGDGSGSGTLNIAGGTLTNNGARHFVGLNNVVGKMNVSGGTFNNTATGNNTWFAVGVKNLANAQASELNVSGGQMNVNRLFSIGGMSTSGHADNNAGFTGGGKGIMTMTGGEVNVTGEFWAGEGTGSNGQITLDAGKINVNSWVAIGRTGGTGSLTVNGGEFNKTGAGSAYIIGASGPGTFVQNGGLVNVQAGDTWIGESSTANFTLNAGSDFRANTVQVARNATATNSIVNLDGGTLTLNRMIGGAGVEDVRFNGTQLVAKADQTGFITALQTATINTGGLKINTNGFNVSTDQNFGGTGSIAKTGAGTLTLTGNSTSSGAATVSAGTLLVNGTLGAATTTVSSGATIGGSGTVGGLAISAGATLAPGNSIGTLTAASASIDGVLAVEYDGAGSGTIDLLNVTGMLNITAATVNFQQLGAPADDGAYIFAKYGTLNGQFANVTNLPSFYTINYAYNDGVSSNNIALVIPEPSALALAGIGALGLLRRRRK